MKNLVLVTGSSGFIGTNLTKRLLSGGCKVIGIDNFSSSERWKSELLAENDDYEFIEHDVTISLDKALNKSRFKALKISEVYNLACPASPPRYQKLALETIEVNTQGLINVLELAKKHKAKVLHSSTSEVYGDPEVHPQLESYRGNVNTVGPRSCYDEGKRIAETICYEYKRLYGIDIKLVRIFNTYGPFMDPGDGRVITNFILQAIKGEDITIYGDGSQTRSFQYIDDLLNGFEAFMSKTDLFGPINLGNPREFTIKKLAEIVIKKVGSKSKIMQMPLPKDDPRQRKPDISRAKTLLNWSPKIALGEGLEGTIKYYKQLSF